ncbi:MAG: hypothetical protein Q4G50_01215 [Corynebacterium sp.]|nr:hypothetical protein [Corynebacterium sp.]
MVPDIDNVVDAQIRVLEQMGCLVINLERKRSVEKIGVKKLIVVFIV